MKEHPANRLTILWLPIFLTLSISCLGTAEETATAGPLVLYASQSGESTLDNGEGGGNPFASALVELLDRRSLTIKKLRTDLVSRTLKKSYGFQTPDIEGTVTPAKIDLRDREAIRVAFVFVYSDYSENSVSSLPGARRDLDRVAGALREAGFSVQTAIDLPKRRLEEKLKEFTEESRNAEIAIIYMTGHGFEHENQVYLASSEFPFAHNPEEPAEHAVRVRTVAEFPQAKRANLVFFGGCRNTYGKRPDQP